MQTFISKEHEKQAFGMTSPGPGTAKPYTSSGVQRLSTKGSSPTWGFGTSRVRNGESKGHAGRRQLCPAACSRSAPLHALMLLKLPHAVLYCYSASRTTQTMRLDLARTMHDVV